MKLIKILDCSLIIVLPFNFIRRCVQKMEQPQILLHIRVPKSYEGKTMRIRS